MFSTSVSLLSPKKNESSDKDNYSKEQEKAWKETVKVLNQKVPQYLDLHPDVTSYEVIYMYAILIQIIRYLEGSHRLNKDQKKALLIRVFKLIQLLNIIE